MPLGDATHIPGGWEPLLWGLPTGVPVYVRARSVGGTNEGSGHASVRRVFLATDVTTSVRGATIADGSGLGTITNDDCATCAASVR